MNQNLNMGCRELSLAETIQHLGGRGLHGALAYTGTRKLEHSDTEVRLYVNGKPGWCYVISVTVNAGDLYDVALWGLRGRVRRVLGGRDDLYFDELQQAVEEVYDQVMRETNSGYIPLR